MGRYIVEDEQQGKERAEYAAETLKIISRELSKEYGKGFSERNLQIMRRFFLVYHSRFDGELISQTVSAKLAKAKDVKSDNSILQTVSAKFSKPFLLSWSHYQVLCRIDNEEEHFFIDLVLYNRLLKCFVIIDLKIGKLKHQDIGQMQMYVNYYDRMVKAPEENKTIGIVICKDKKDAVVEMTLPENNKQIFSSKYQLYLPSKEELKALLKSEHKEFEKKHEQE